MNITRPLIYSAVVAGVTFCVSAFPLTIVGSHFVAIQWEEEPVFAGQFRELSKPYFGLAALLGMGTGAASLAALIWRQSSRQLHQAEDQLSDLQQQLQARDKLIESLTFSQSRLESSGLEVFLHDETIPSIARSNGKSAS